MTNVPSIKLSSGHRIPSIGLGLWKVTNEEVSRVISTALDVGYRHIDTAAIYNNEKALGNTLKEEFKKGKVTRNDLFITSKLWVTNFSPEKAKAAFLKTLHDLQLEYLDLYLIHWPFALQADNDGNIFRDKEGKAKIEPIPIIDTWRVLEDLFKQGLVRSIGVSNFPISTLKDLLPKCKIRPAVNQIESHPYFPMNNLIKYCKDENIVVQVYSPLGSGKTPSILNDPIINKVAEMAHCTPAQVLIGWALKRNTIPLPKSSNEHRLVENITIIDLTDEMMNLINGIEKRHSYIDPNLWAGVEYSKEL